MNTTQYPLHGSLFSASRVHAPTCRLGSRHVEAADEHARFGPLFRQQPGAALEIRRAKRGSRRELSERLEKQLRRALIDAMQVVHVPAGALTMTLQTAAQDGAGKANIREGG